MANELTMPNTKEKLIDILLGKPNKCTFEELADCLLANGVTIQKDYHWATKQAYKNGYEDGKPKWIPVTERLPEKDQNVWCYSNKYGGHFFMGYRGYCTGEWIENGCLHIGEVTHWMPLPEPPKGE